MSTISVDDDGGLERSARIVADLRDLQSDEEILKHLISAGEMVVDQAKSEIQNKGHILSGDLHASIDIYEKGAAHIVVGSDKQQAVYIEFGRGEIKAKKGKFLRWVDPHTGKVIFAKKSRAVLASPFLGPAVLDATERYVGLVAQEFASWIEDAKKPSGGIGGGNSSTGQAKMKKISGKGSGAFRPTKNNPA